LPGAIDYNDAKVNFSPESSWSLPLRLLLPFGDSNTFPQENLPKPIGIVRDDAVDAHVNELRHLLGLIHRPDGHPDAQLVRGLDLRRIEIPRIN
jgi:hypothetical protein